MSNLQLILIILGSLFTVIQVSFVAIAIALVRANPGRRLNMGLGWILLGAVCFIAAVLV